MKEYIVTFKSRYYPYEGTRTRRVIANSKKIVRLTWHDIINTDEYVIVKIDEVKRNG